MQRVVFLIEATGERLTALINPERLDFTRRSGLHALRHAGGAITGNDLSDDPLVVTGGGTTELTLDLLFDVDLMEDLGQRDEGDTAAQSERERVALGLALPRNTALADVREMTRPFWNLTENIGTEGRRGAPPLIRFIWGRSWNVLGFILAVAERFERLDEEGRPRRSFLRLRMRRADEALAGATADVGMGSRRGSGSVTPFYELAPLPGAEGAEAAGGVEVQADGDGISSPRLEQLAVTAGGVPADWRRLAIANRIEDPLRVAPGTILAVPRMTGAVP